MEPTVPQNPQPQQQAIYPVNLTDHDLLIRVDQKLTILSESVAKTNDGLTERLGKVEAKIVYYDQILAEFPPAKGTEQVNANTKWISDFKLTWKLIIAMVVTGSSVITFLLMALGNIFHIIGFFGSH